MSQTPTFINIQRVVQHRIRPDTLWDFEQAWHPDPYPEGLPRAYAYWSQDGQEITGVSR
ncbi:hypothetical protein ACFY1U_33785 [Streptomyces sp. NPDC001351]|uniref:hypothetical protein n=1 Tax=Streptomyces sp. NPDC001351 TaxID=3364564 RepID=UPI0036B7FFBD